MARKKRIKSKEVEAALYEYPCLMILKHLKESLKHSVCMNFKY